MHEATLAENIIQIAIDTAAENHATNINEISLKLGAMSGVEVDALQFSFDIIKRGTIAENAILTIHRIPITAQCNKCHKHFTVEHYNFFCPECDGVLILQSGRELLVDFVDCD